MILKQTLEIAIEKALTLKEISEELNTSITNIRYWLKKYNLTTKSTTRKFRKVLSCPIHEITTFNKHRRCNKCNVERVTKRRRNLKILAIQYKGGQCEICGYNKCNRSLDFHHLDPIKKEFGLSTNGYTRSWEKVKEELDKCILVCSNCHGEIHEKLEIKNYI